MQESFGSLKLKHCLQNNGEVILSNYLNKKALASGLFVTFLYICASIVSLIFDYELYSFFHYLFLLLTLVFWVLAKNDSDKSVSIKFLSHYSLLLFGYWSLYLDYIYTKPFTTISSVLFMMFSALAALNIYFNLRAMSPQNLMVKFFYVNISLLFFVISFLLFLYGLIKISAG